MKFRDNDLAAIKSLSPDSESWARRIQRLLQEIEKQKTAGVTYSRMAGALGINPAILRVYLHRARKRATKIQAGVSVASASATTTKSDIEKAQPDLTLTTPEGRRAAQAARFNLNVLTDDGEA